MEGLEQAPEIEQEEVLDQEVEQIDPEEEKARAGGWRPKEDWVNAGHDPDEWKSYKQFNKDGELINTIKELQRTQKEMQSSFESRLENSNKMHELQKKALMADLEEKRKQAVETADTETFNKVQSQIDEMQADTAPQKTHNPDVDIINSWNAANPWINDHSPKAAYAQTEFNRLQSAGVGVSEAIRQMEASVAREFPPTNPRRDQAPKGEIPKKTLNNKPKKLSVRDCTQEELKFKHFYASEEEFLQAVMDTRG